MVKIISKAMKKAAAVRSAGFLNHYRAAFADAHGLVSIGQITAECIGIMVLICILVILPMVASSVQDNLPEIKEGSAWYNYTDTGVNTWASVYPLISVACLIVIIGLVLHVIMSLKNRNE